MGLESLDAHKEFLAVTTPLIVDAVRILLMREKSRFISKQTTTGLAFMAGDVYKKKSIAHVIVAMI